jgi:hypothetical protein
MPPRWKRPFAQDADPRDPAAFSMTRRDDLPALTIGAVVVSRDADFYRPPKLRVEDWSR